MTTSCHPNILMAHCYYRERGGEDHSFEAESDLLARHGCSVVPYVRSNREIDRLGLRGRLLLPFHSIWASDTYHALSGLLRRTDPCIAHFQNTFPLISQSAYGVCRRRGVPVVQTLRNFRFVCPTATLMRDGRVCEDCIGRSLAWPGILHACYHGSRAQTAVVATMTAIHDLLGTWRRSVSLFIAPTHFARRKFIEGGLSPESIVVKPNFTGDPGQPGPAPARGPFLYVGRLSSEKGVTDLIRAASLLKPPPALRIVGDGPERQSLGDLAHTCGFSRGIFAGHLPRESIFNEMRQAACVVVPSRCYETFGRTVIEAYACGRPVIASAHGALAEIVRDGETGLLFEAGRVESLSSALDRIVRDPRMQMQLGMNARREYETSYTPETNYRMLMGTYRLAIQRAGRALPEVFRPFPPATVPRDTPLTAAVPMP